MKKMQFALVTTFTALSVSALRFNTEHFNYGLWPSKGAFVTAINQLSADLNNTATSATSTSDIAASITIFENGILSQ
jgi:hypothetical protein